MTLVIAWIATAVVFGVLDAIWLSQMGPRLYRPALGAIMHDGVRIGPAAAFYLIYVTGLVALAVAPALERASVTHAVVTGAIVGLVAYATYNLTNHATLRVWDIRVTLADMAWGTFASAATAGAACWIAQRFG